MTTSETQSGQTINCEEDPIASLTEMFVGMVQEGRIKQGQCPVLRPVFLKPHGVVKGTFTVRSDIADTLKVGLFAQPKSYDMWARFSSDTSPTFSDFKTTLGIGIKLFDTPTPKIFGLPDETTFDFILQNMDVFFVDTAKDMCAFSKAGIVYHDYDSYLKKHPKTQKILNEMEKPVPSVLASPYWSGLPFALGESQYVKYKLVPSLTLPDLTEPPADPTYLAVDLQDRLRKGEAKFTFCVQLRTNPATMPLDEATVRWPESESPYVPVADLVFQKQDIEDRGQAAYGENMSWNIWRVTAEHTPQGSIADARKVVYAASAEKRRNVNGVPNGEPVSAKPILGDIPRKDETIVTARIHPGIGVARVGDSPTEWFLAPEVTTPPNHEPDHYRDATGALKREAARFRVYGYNAAGQVVRELTNTNANIVWTAHLVNRKPDFFRFIKAMDIPEAKDLDPVIRRNAKVRGAERHTLVVDPGSRSITGANVSGGSEHAFSSGTFMGQEVPLGEIQTDEDGHLIVLGGHGNSFSTNGSPPYDKDEPDTFNNADGWTDDTADGPIDAKVSVNGQDIPVEGAWVVVAPPNYAPNIVSWRTMYDMMTDVYVNAGWFPIPATTSFTKDVLPQLQRLSNLQWVNKGFAALYGKGMPMDFENPTFISRLSKAKPPAGPDPWAALRNQILNAFRPFDPKVNEPRIWPALYGDGFDSDLFQPEPNTMLALPSLQQLHLQRWVAGTFIDDYDPKAKAPTSLKEVPLADQPAMLDQAPLHFCLADAFHPGCEMTWPMRHITLYEKPYRIRRLAEGQSPPNLGDTLTQEKALSLNGPLHGQQAGDITRWMGLPWQGDTAYCRSGYDPTFDLYLPAFWPATTPNQVLTAENYAIVMDETATREERIVAYNDRAFWTRIIDNPRATIANTMERMIKNFSHMGLILAKPGPKDDPDFPSVIYVENLPKESQQTALTAAVALATSMKTMDLSQPESRVQAAGWGSEEYLANVLHMRSRGKTRK